ncbi:hypothetical protein [Salinisphaera hydrothermalis]|uniref:hypothetical protein n=1 Tax=Salinisphaera hydrothermalis TaxID=563188 RepID=UPI0033414E48
MVNGLIALMAAVAALVNIATALIPRRRDRRWVVFPWLMAIGLVVMAAGLFVHSSTMLALVCAGSVCLIAGAALLLRFSMRGLSATRGSPD